VEGRLLLSRVEVYRNNYPRRSVRWCLKELCKRDSRYGPIDQLVTRYYEALRHFRTTKQSRN
jgi:hypothetical protein